MWVQVFLAGLCFWLFGDATLAPIGGGGLGGILAPCVCVCDIVLLMCQCQDAAPWVRGCVRVSWMDVSMSGKGNASVTERAMPALLRRLSMRGRA